MDPIKVGNYLASLRREKNLTQEELAERINVSSKTVSKWEVGTNIPDTNCLYKLSKEYNVPTQDILNGGIIQNESENNDSIKNGINFYNKLFKRKFIKILVLVIIGLVTTFSILYTISNYNKVHVYDITTSDDNFRVKGYLVFNSKEAIFMIDNIRFQDGFVGTNAEYISNYSIFIKGKSETIYYKDEKEINDFELLTNILNNVRVSFIIENNNLINSNLLNDFYLNINISTQNNQSYEYKIKLNMKEHFSNNKIVY